MEHIFEAAVVAAELTVIKTEVQPEEEKDEA